MLRRRWFGVTVSCALSLLGGANAGCDVGGSNLFQASGGAPATPVGGSAGTSASAGTSGSAGSGTVGPGGPCTTSSQCTDQVCSPGGSCVDCNEDKDCLTNQYCDATHCVATGGDTGGSGSGGSSGSGGGGGGTSTGSCGDAQVLFVIQRSGIMFEQPDDTNYWTMVKEGITGTDGALGAYDGKLKTGALFFVRVADADECPVTSKAAPQLAATMPLAELFTSNESDYQKLADADTKMDAPVPEAVAAAAGLVMGSARHLVLITTGGPDTCDKTDDGCLVDPAIKAVQDAQKMG